MEDGHMIRSIVFAFLFLGTLPSLAGPIVNGLEWFQPADLTGFTWHDFDAICSPAPCSGRVGGSGPDITGWTWADVDAVNALFNDYIGSQQLVGPRCSGRGPGLCRLRLLFRDRAAA